MTKLDRAIDNGERLKDLDDNYESQNISSLDLFNLLKKVNRVDFFSLFFLFIEFDNRLHQTAMIWSSIAFGKDCHSRVLIIYPSVSTKY